MFYTAILGKNYFFWQVSIGMAVSISHGSGEKQNSASTKKTLVADLLQYSSLGPKQGLLKHLETSVTRKPLPF